MIAIKVICFKHTMEDFYRMNKEFIVDTNISFQCDCDTYGNHRMYFCVCYPCLNDLQDDKSLYVLNNWWMKFCSAESNLNSITFNGKMRFFRYHDINLPIQWYERLSIFRKKF